MQLINNMDEDNDVSQVSFNPNTICTNVQYPDYLNDAILSGKDHFEISELVYANYWLPKNSEFLRNNPQLNLMKRFTFLLDLGGQNRQFKNTNVYLKPIQYSRIKEFIDEKNTGIKPTIVDYMIIKCSHYDCASSFKNNGIINQTFPHVHGIHICTNEINQTRFKSQLYTYLGVDDETYEHNNKTRFYRNFSFAKITTNLSPYGGLLKYFKCTAAVVPDYATDRGVHDQPVCKKYPLFSEVSLYLSSMWSCNVDDWALNLGHKLMPKHLNCFMDKYTPIYQGVMDNAVFSKYDTFFKKYGVLSYDQVISSFTDKDLMEVLTKLKRNTWDIARARYMAKVLKNTPFSGLWLKLDRNKWPRKDPDEERTIGFLDSLLEVNRYDQDKKERFCTDLYNVLAKSHGKTNTFYLFGVASSGKSVIMQACRNVMCVVGEYVNSKSFSFGDFTNKSMLSFEDFSHPDESSVPTLKKLWEGLGDVKVDVKYATPKLIPKTPCIVTSNHSLEDLFIQLNDRDINAFRKRVCPWEFPTAWYNPGGFKITIHPQTFINWLMSNLNLNVAEDFDYMAYDQPYYNHITGRVVMPAKQFPGDGLQLPPPVQPNSDTDVEQTIDNFLSARVHYYNV